MEWTIPGTVLTCPKEEAEQIPEHIRSLFLGGGITLSQVVAITGLESHTIQNWVKRGFLTSPEKKRYSLRQLCRILNIHMLKYAIPLDKVCALLGYVNGRLDDEQDDIIDDSELYFLFVGLAAQADTLLQATDREAVIRKAMERYTPPSPGAQERVEIALRIMLTAHLATRLYQQTENLLHTIL